MSEYLYAYLPLSLTCFTFIHGKQLLHTRTACASLLQGLASKEGTEQHPTELSGYFQAVLAIKSADGPVILENQHMGTSRRGCGGTKSGLELAHLELFRLARAIVISPSRKREISRSTGLEMSPILRWIAALGDRDDVGKGICSLRWQKRPQTKRDGFAPTE